jgi:hypothetical protein
MTTRRWMAVIAANSIALWLGITADRVNHDYRKSGRVYHLWERRGVFEPGSLFNSQHPAPFWPRYWRRLFGQTWPGSYACDQCIETHNRYGRLALTIAIPLDNPNLKVLSPDAHHANRALSQYYKEYVPRHWNKHADGEWLRYR